MGVASVFRRLTVLSLVLRPVVLQLLAAAVTPFAGLQRLLEQALGLHDGGSLLLGQQDVRRGTAGGNRGVRTQLHAVHRPRALGPAADSSRPVTRSAADGRFLLAPSPQVEEATDTSTAFTNR